MTPPTKQAREEFVRQCETVMDILLDLRDDVGRGKMPVPDDAVGFFLKDLKAAGDTVNHLRLVVRDGTL